jgi:hypothetical protein
MVGTTRSQAHVDNADDLTYNPQASALHDDAAFNNDGDFESAQPLGARGADNQPTNRNFAREDKETERSEQLGQIPRCEYTPSFVSPAWCINLFQPRSMTS